MNSSKAGSSRGPVTRRRAAEELRGKEENKRSRQMWKPGKVIGPNDIIVDTNKGKIKIEEDVDVKDVFEGVPAPAQDPTQDKLLSAHFDLDLRHVLLEEIDVPMDCGDGGDYYAGMNEVNNNEVEKQYGSGCQKEIELLKIALKKQNLTIQMLVTRVTENEKQMAKLCERLQKHEKNAVVNFPVSSSIFENSDKTEIMDIQSNPDYRDATISSESSDDKVITLFPEVIKVFWTKYAKGKENSKSYLNLNCRLVCKSWRDGIDYLLMNEDGLVKTKGSKTVNIRCYDESKYFEDRAEETVAKLFDLYEKNKKGWRLLQPHTLYIYTETYILSKLCSNDSKYGKVICKFLEEFGTGVETFRHYHDGQFSHQNSRFLDAYNNSIFNTWILQMPNLKCLDIFYVNRGGSNTSTTEVIEGTEIEKSVRLSPFPKLTKLETFRFSAPEALSSVMIPIVLKMNNHISSFHSNMSLNFNQFCLPNLTKVVCLPDGETNLTALPALNSFDGKILIKLNSLFECETNDIIGRLATLETINELWIDAYAIRFYQVPFPFPNLKVFVLNIESDSAENPFFTVQFIFKMVSQMSSLERLEIFGLRENTRNGYKMLKPGSGQSLFGGTRAQFTKCMRKELVCKLCETIPSLKLIKIERISKLKRNKERKGYFSFRRI